MTDLHSPRRREGHSDIELGAFNAAFYELGLRWHWDASTYSELAEEPSDRSRVRRYVQREQPHLLRAYDAEFLTDAILATKERWRRALDHAAAPAAPSFNWADARWGEVGI